ncbi:MAG: 50S ribosomal protein L35 [Clostridiales bacterium]|nr:50S ribosomal protein L35 [Clostridiales bacterium]MDD7432292.1 50S ribosomal protein L35 [Clostridiales bacterium]MDY3062266.1 50S ribosomal protein L35 [Eubacteriales bacterium]
MPKMKTHSSSKKRYKVSGSGKIRRAQAFKKHILTKKTSKRKRNLRKIVELSPANAKKVRQLIPYK